MCAASRVSHSKAISVNYSIFNSVHFFPVQCRLDFFTRVLQIVPSGNYYLKSHDGETQCLTKYFIKQYTVCLDEFNRTRYVHGGPS